MNLTNSYKRPHTVIILVIFFLLSQPTNADPITLADSLAISIYKPSELEITQIAEAGFTLARLDVRWAETEKVSNIYSWERYDTLIQTLVAHHIRPIIILDYSNTLYEPQYLDPDNGMRTHAPSTNKSRAAFAAWAVATAKHYEYAKPIFEIWNEPDLRMFWPPSSNPKNYVSLALKTCTALRQALPTATIIGPALATPPSLPKPHSPLLSAVLKSPLPRCLDAISIHPYQITHKPELASQIIAQTRQLISTLTSPTANLPIIASEMGYPTYTPRSPSYLITGRQQAAYLVRQHLLHLLHNVPLTVWYSWRDGGTDTHDAQHNYGITKFSHEPKPAYYAIKHLTERFGDYHVSGRIYTSNSRTIVLQLKSPTGSDSIIAWTTKISDTLVFPSNTTEAQAAYDIFGIAQPVTRQSDTITLRLSEIPQYMAID